MKLHSFNDRYLTVKLGKDFLLQISHTGDENELLIKVLRDGVMLSETKFDALIDSISFGELVEEDVSHVVIRRES